MNNRLMRIGDRLSIPNSRFVQVCDTEIMNLDEISRASYDYGNSTLEIFFADGVPSLVLHDDAAEDFWKYLSSASLNLTRQVEEAIAQS